MTSTSVNRASHISLLSVPLVISGWLRHSLVMTTSASAPGSAARLIALRSEVATALTPENLVATDLSVTPRWAALSLLSSQPSFWEAHVVTVAFAMDNVGENPSDVVEMLASRERVSNWFYDDQFLGYLSRQYIATSRSGLVRAAEVIESGLNKIALRQAQFGTVLIEYCVQQCQSDIQCLQRCLNS